MHPVISIRHWSHHLHDGMLNMRHEIDQYLHNRHFWIGVAVTLAFIGLVALLIILAEHAPIMMPSDSPAGTTFIPYR